jgi:dTDP-4-amino-4,6-dideoxygalactose transaminase
VKYKGKALLSYGDISICSFHSTKLFHTIEGGCVIAKNKKVSKKLDLLKNFGHLKNNYKSLGINAKASEFQAAMGLCNFEYLDFIIKATKTITHIYDKLLKGNVQRPLMDKNLEYNYYYYSVIFKNEIELLEIVKVLNKNKIYPKRYFYPSLNTLPYMNNRQSCPTSEDISKRILCLPLYAELKKQDVEKISNIILKYL